MARRWFLPLSLWLQLTAFVDGTDVSFPLEQSVATDAWGDRLELGRARHGRRHLRPASFHRSLHVPQGEDVFYGHNPTTGGILHLVRRGNANVVGTLHDSSGMQYAIRPDPSTGALTAHLVDPTAFGSEDHVAIDLDDPKHAHLRVPTPTRHHRALQSAEVYVITIMVLYTNAAACDASNQASDCTVTAQMEETMETVIDLAVSQTNTAMAVSGANVRLELIHTYREPNYSEAGKDSDNVLDDLFLQTTPELNEVWDVREEYGADLVTMVTAPIAGSCGRATFSPTGVKSLVFSFVTTECIVDNYSFAHEGTYASVGLFGKTQ